MGIPSRAISFTLTCDESYVVFPTVCPQGFHDMDRASPDLQLLLCSMMSTVTVVIRLDQSMKLHLRTN